MASVTIAQMRGWVNLARPLAGALGPSPWHGGGLRAPFSWALGARVDHRGTRLEEGESGAARGCLDMRQTRPESKEHTGTPRRAGPSTARPRS